MTRSTGWLAAAGVVAAGCAVPELRTVGTRTLFEGGDGLEVALERVLSGTLTADTVLDAAEPWILDGTVFVGDDGDRVDLTIEPGTVIYGNPGTRGTLVVQRGSRIVAEGTAAEPIVFTSPRARGARRAGDWGGLAINGYAPVNGCSSAPCELEGEGGSGLYGGDDPSDDSGILQYVRIEFAGALWNTEDELNGLALQGVGSGTTLDYVQLHVAADDGIEFFGGTVNASHVVITGANDDSLDWTGGWQGSMQYVAVQMHPNSGDKGIEADNNEDDHDALPRSEPNIANLTAVGREGAGTAFLFRRGTGVRLSNSVIVGFDTCVDVQDDPTWVNAYDGVDPSGELVVQGTWLSCASPYSSSGWSTHTVQSLLEIDNLGNVVGDPGLVDPSDVDGPDFRLTEGSAALAAAVPVSGSLDDVSFVGAFDAEDDWTSGWITTGTN